MFEDILEYNKEDVKASSNTTMIDEFAEKCPSCGSDNVGSMPSAITMELFCVDCGHVWFL